MNSQSPLARYLAILESTRARFHPNRFRFYAEYIFGDVCLEGRRVLDVGGGTGLFSFYAACMGASQVLCLEPEAEGASSGAIASFHDLSYALGAMQVRLEPYPLQRFESAGEDFDLVLLHNSVNHLDERACTTLDSDPESRAQYLAILQKLFRLSATPSRLIIADCSRRNIFALCHMRNPLAPNIDWHKHQRPEVWVELLSEIGYTNPRLRWSSPSRLGGIGRWLLGNEPVAFFLQSHFCLHMDKVGC